VMKTAWIWAFPKKCQATGSKNRFYCKRARGCKKIQQARL